jgi:type IV pilus assembly protein PilY1
VGGLGAGGSAIYALDVTTPSLGNFKEANAATLVKGEWSSATISCIGNATCGNSLGNTYGTPQIRRFHNGNWGAVFGNGYGSANGDAGIFVMIVSQGTGAISFYYLSACTGGNPCNTGGNGIAYVSPVDLDGDHVTDYVYAGDLKGNVWRFDLTSANAASWAVTTPGPLFKTPAGQPITTPLALASAIVSGSAPQIIVAFGTGQRTQFTTTSATSYVTGTQSIYGVWDWNLSTWNSNSGAKYASLTNAQVQSATALASPFTLKQANLQQQTFSVTGSTISASNTTFLWEQCAPGCNAGKFGWFVNLPSGSGATSGGAAVLEQIVSSPTLFQDAFIVNSTIPANNRPLDCTSPTTDGGVTYALSVVSGGTFAKGGASPTPATTTFQSAFVNYRDTPTVGILTNETGALSVVNTKENTTFLVGQDISIPQGGAPGGVQQIALTNTSVNRLTWVELR